MRKAPSHSYGTSPVIRDHTVLPAPRHKWTRLALTPVRKAGTRLTYPGGMEDWVDLGGWLHTEMVYPPPTYPSINRAWRKVTVDRDWLDSLPLSQTDTIITVCPLSTSVNSYSTRDSYVHDTCEVDCSRTAGYIHTLTSMTFTHSTWSQCCFSRRVCVSAGCCQTWLISASVKITSASCRRKSVSWVEFMVCSEMGVVTMSLVRDVLRRFFPLCHLGHVPALFELQKSRIWPKMKP